MSQRRNLAASVKQRLLNLARERGEEFNLLLNRFGIERLLYRLSRSEHGADFVLKDAMLFHLRTTAPHRPTRDVDLLGRGSPDPARLERIFRAICDTDMVEDDGILLLAASVNAEPIQEGAEFEGIRIQLEGRLGTARIPMQVDVGFGDAGDPPPEECEFPALLGHPAPRLLVYRRETVVAEKLHAMVDLGIANSRMRDFYDLRFLAATFEFGGASLTRAIVSTFARRRTAVPGIAPTALTDAFARDVVKRMQWRAFVRRSRLETEDLDLDEVIRGLRDFLLSPIEAAAGGRPLDLVWPAGGPWRTPEHEHT